MKIVFKKTEIAQVTVVMDRITTLLNERFNLSIPLPIGLDPEIMFQEYAGLFGDIPAISILVTDDEISIEYDEEFMLESLDLLQSFVNKAMEFTDKHKLIITIATISFKGWFSAALPVVGNIFKPLMEPVSEFLEGFGETVTKFTTKWLTPKSEPHDNELQTATDPDHIKAAREASDKYGASAQVS